MDEISEDIPIELLQTGVFIHDQEASEHETLLLEVKYFMSFCIRKLKETFSISKNYKLMQKELKIASEHRRMV